MSPIRPGDPPASPQVPETTRVASLAEGASAGFASLGLSAPLVSAVAALGYEEPTPIQREAIPVLLAGRDVSEWSWERGDVRPDVESDDDGFRR